MMRDWFDMSRRLRRYLYYSPTVYGYKWIAQCGHWTVLIVRKSDVYKELD
jgi:hypothetical protein